MAFHLENQLVVSIIGGVSMNKITHLISVGVDD